MRKIFSLLLFLAATSFALADNTQKVTVSGTTIDKTVKQLSFSGDNVVMNFTDGTSQTEDMSNVIITFSTSTAIKALSSEPENAPTQYFDMSGRLLKSAPQHGPFIMRKGGKIVKVLKR